MAWPAEVDAFGITDLAEPVNGQGVMEGHPTPFAALRATIPTC